MMWDSLLHANPDRRDAESGVLINVCEGLSVLALYNYRLVFYAMVFHYFDRQ